MNNVVDFESRKNQQECEHEEICEHCEFVQSVTDGFIEDVAGLKLNSPEFRDEVEALIEFVTHVTRRDTIADIGIGLLGTVESMDEHMDGDCDDSDDEEY